MTDRWMDRLSEYLDGDLAPSERAALEAHLPGCAPCRAALDDLRHVVARAHGLVGRPVGTELWGGIATRIGASGAPVVDLAARRARHRITLSLPQLAAAAVLLVAVGAGVASLTPRPPRRPRRRWP